MSIEAKPSGSGSATHVGRWIVVSLADHEICVLQDGGTVHAIHSFSTGRAGHLTPLIANGRIDPHRRFREHISSLYKNKSGKGAEMPFATFFQAACAFHAGDPNVESHGCIHLARADAEWLFNWVGENEVDLQILGPRPKASPGTV